MKPKLIVLPVVAAVVFLGLLAGCPNSRTSSSRPSGQQTASGSTPLTIAISDWPGWLLWEIAQEKNFFQDAGVDVELDWHDYSACIAAFKAGEVDGVFLVCNDALVAGALG